jgi:curved DNA-binding protein CbpA
MSRGRRATRCHADPAGVAGDPAAVAVTKVFIRDSARTSVSSPFDILQVSPDADEKELERAYRRRVVETHPDQGGSREEFQLVREAYEQLSSGSYSDAREIEREEVDEPVEREQVQIEVEYLNYAVLEDYGWSLDDENLFEKAAGADLDPADYGRFAVEPGEVLLQAAENRGFAWPFACRGGACANCAVAVTTGELEMSIDHVLPTSMLDRGIRLSCIGEPTTDQLQVVYNVKQLPDLDELKLPADRFEKARSDD